MHNPSDSPEVPRRGFFYNAATVLISGVVGVVPVVGAVIHFLDPLLRRRATYSGGAEVVDAKGFIKLPTAKAANLAVGVPTEFPVSVTVQDAWAKSPDTPIGSVYLIKDEQGGLTCFNSQCPHLGCTVKYKSDQQKFVCPCHDSAFSMSGERTNQIPPRSLDTLEVTEKDGTVWVQFKNFVPGREEKKEVS